MITRIELANFMSHQHTVLEPAAGLTVLVGPNNCGKSAVVAALQILCHNENSTYVLRHGEKECSVKITTDDGHTVEWRRRKSPSYVIDGQAFDRLRGAALPEELQRALRLPQVDDGCGGQFDVHFGEQKSPIFLLDQSAASAAKFFSSSSDASRLLAMQRRHKEKLSQRQRDKNRLEAESRQLNAELEALAPAVDLDEQLQAVEQEHRLLGQAAAWLVQAEQDQAALTAQHQTLTWQAAQSQALAPLTQPPALPPTQPLEELALQIERSERDVAQSEARIGTLAVLSDPPVLADDAALATLLQRLSTWTATADREEGSQACLKALSAPPALVETTDLAGLVERLAAGQRELDASSSRQAALAGIAAPPELSDERSLADALAQLAAAERHVARWAETTSSSAIEPPELPGDWKPLADCVAELELTADRAGRMARELESATADLQQAEASLREFAASEICPTCGSPLDAERLLAGAAFASGGHAHG